MENSLHFIAADDFRVKGEKLILGITLAVFAGLLLLLSSMTIGIFIAIILVTVLLVKMKQSNLLGNGIKVTEKQMPEIFDCAKTAAERLSMKMPDVFIIQDPVINAFSFGIGLRKTVVLHSALVECFSRNELISVLGHEFSHVKCGHTKWLVFVSSTNSLQIPIISDIMRLIFMAWLRKCEMTADRGSTIASRDISAFAGSFAKIAIGAALCQKLDLENFFQQKIDLETDGFAKVAQLLASHPFMVNRMHLIKKYVDSEEYKNLIK